MTDKRKLAEALFVVWWGVSNMSHDVQPEIETMVKASWSAAEEAIKTFDALEDAAQPAEEEP